jgi:hypothetical protein
MAFDLAGSVFGRLTAIKIVGHTHQGIRLWECLCSCGQFSVVTSPHLRRGHTKSCGCLAWDNPGRPITHGHTRNRKHSLTYSSWRSMHQRCRNPRSLSFKNYGARGISIAERWYKFANFLEDMGERPIGLTLERRNNDFGYFKENCKWDTRKAQNRNHRRIKLTFKQACEVALRALKGERHRLIAGDFGISVTMVSSIATGRKWKDAVKCAADQFQLERKL